MVVISRRLRLAFALVFIAVLSAAGMLSPSKADAATNSGMNFQARLQNAAGGVVADGYYNIEFKIYDSSSSSGSGQGSCSGDSSCQWVETRTGSDTVKVKNGYVSVNLGGVTALPDIDWSQQLWLTMRVGGMGSPSWDQEMTPRLRLTATPYAQAAGKLSASNGSFSSSLSLTAPTGGNQNFQVADQGAAGTFAILSAGQQIQNGTSLQSGANFNLSGSGTAGTSFLTPLLDTASNIALNIGTNNATAINLNADTQLASGAKLSFANTSNANKVLVQSGVTTSAYTLTLPTALSGNAGDCLVDTTGAGVLGFATCGTGSGGLSAIGAFSNTTSYANGATISGGTITFGAANASNPGLMSAGTQTIAGAKTFLGQVQVSGTIASDFAFKASNSSATGLGIYGYANSASGSIDVLRLNGSGGTVLSIKTNGDSAISGSLGIGTAPSSGSKLKLVGNSAQSGLSVKGASGVNISSFSSSSPAVVATIDSSGGLHTGSVIAGWFGTTTSTTVGFYTNNQLRMSVNGTTGDVTVTTNMLQSGSSTFATGSGAVSLNGNTTLAAGKTLTFANSGNSNTVSLQSGTTATSYTLTLPTAVGSSGECLQATNGTGALGFGTCGGSISSVGGMNGIAKTANGAGTYGGKLFMQAASTAYAGLVTNTAQTFAGAKSFAANTTFRVNNNQTAASLLSLQQRGTGDTSMEFRNSSTSFYLGQDTSSSDAFVINSKTAAIAKTGGTLTDAFSTPAFKLSQTGSLILQNVTDSTAALTVMNVTGIPLFGADTTNKAMTLGSSTTDATGVVMVLDGYNNASDPTGINGAMYYNSSMKVFRCYEGGAWKDCLTHHLVTLTADTTDNSGNCTLTNLGNLSFQVASGRQYRFHVTAGYTTTAATNGVLLSATGPTANYLSYTFSSPTAVGALGGGGAGANNGGTCTANSLSTTANTAILDGIISPSASGALQITFATEAGNPTIVMKAGSTLEWW